MGRHASRACCFLEEHLESPSIYSRRTAGECAPLSFHAVAGSRETLLAFLSIRFISAGASVTYGLPVQGLREDALIFECLERCCHIIELVLKLLPITSHARKRHQVHIKRQQHMFCCSLRHAVSLLSQDLPPYCKVMHKSSILDDSSRPDVCSVSLSGTEDYPTESTAWS